MKRGRVVHMCVPEYELVQWATTHASDAPADSCTSGTVATFQFPPVHQVQIGLRPICGAPVRPMAERRRVTDFAGTPCKRCARMVKKRERRKKNRGYAARHATPSPAKTNPATPGSTLAERYKR